MTDFYSSPAWKRARYECLKRHKAMCYCCGRTPRHHGVSLQVDHKKPRSKHPELALVQSNLVPCCDLCNGAKSDTYYDWSPRWGRYYMKKAARYITSTLLHLFYVWCILSFAYTPYGPQVKGAIDNGFLLAYTHVTIYAEDGFQLLIGSLSKDE